MSGKIGKIDLDVFNRFIMNRLGKPNDRLLTGPRTGVDAAVIRMGDKALVVAEDPIFPAAGVHLGQSDMPVREARCRLGPDAVIGLSTDTLDQALADTVDLADYIGVGPVFATATKTDTEQPWGLEGVRNLRRLTGQTLVGVGGIGSENAAAVIAAGCDGIAVVTAICSSHHPETAAGDLARRIRTA